MNQTQPLRIVQKSAGLILWREEYTRPIGTKRAPHDTERLIRATFAQDADAGISLLFREYYAILCSHAIRYVAAEAIAEAIVSDVFYEFHSERHYQTLTTSFRTHLFTVVRERVFDFVQNKIS